MKQYSPAVLAWLGAALVWIVIPQAQVFPGGRPHTILSALHTDTTVASVVKGDTLVFNGTTWVRLGVGANTQVLTADSTTAEGVKWAAAPGGSVTMYTVVLSAPGDGMARYTVTNANVLSTSKIIGAVRRSDVADVDDHGWIYDANVVQISAGSFELLVQLAVLPGDGTDDALLADPPTGTYEFQYVIG